MATSQEKWSPGEWLTGYYTPSESFKGITEHMAVMSQDGKLLAVTGPFECALSQADAELMSASKDMYEALKTASYWIGKLAHWNGTDLSELDGYESIPAALAKARGELSLPEGGK